MAEELTNLEQLLEHIGRTTTGDQERVSLGMILEAIGSRSFGPLLLFAGIIMVSPLSGIPGIPTTMALFVLLIAGQLLFGRKHFWLPQLLLKRSVSCARLHRALKWLEPPARGIDRWLKPRQTIFVRRSGAYVIAIICIFIAAGMPVMELLPFTATTAGLVLTVFGLALVAHDGLLALLAFGLTAIICGLVILRLL